MARLLILYTSNRSNARSNFSARGLSSPRSDIQRRTNVTWNSPGMMSRRPSNDLSAFTRSTTDYSEHSGSSSPLSLGNPPPVMQMPNFTSNSSGVSSQYPNNGNSGPTYMQSGYYGTATTNARQQSTHPPGPGLLGAHNNMSLGLQHQRVPHHFHGSYMGVPQPFFTPSGASPMASSNAAHPLYSARNAQRNPYPRNNTPHFGQAISHDTIAALPNPRFAAQPVSTTAGYPRGSPATNPDNMRRFIQQEPSWEYQGNDPGGDQSQW